jgi:hypothetical protein
VERIASSVRGEVKHVKTVAAHTKGMIENGKRADIVLPSYFPEVVMFSDLAVLIGLSWASAFRIHGSDWALLSSMPHFLFLCFITTSKLGSL